MGGRSAIGLVILTSVLWFAAGGGLCADERSSEAHGAEQAITDYIKAEGGVKALAGVRAVEFDGTLRQGQNASEGAYTLVLEQPNRYYQELTLGGKTEREAYNGRSAWRQDAAGPRTLTGSESDAFESWVHARNDRLLHYRKEKLRALALGSAQFGGRSVQKLETIASSGFRRDLYFDPATHLLAGEVVPAKFSGDGSEETVVYGDYRAVDGIPEPYRIEFHRGNENWVATMTRVTHHPQVSDSAFLFPQASDRAMPDIASLLKSVESNQKALEKLVEQYTCDKTEEQFQVDSHGDLQSKEDNEYQVYYLDGDEVDRLIRKNGKELSAEETQHQNERIQKRIEKYEKEHAKDGAGGDSAQKSHKDDVKVSDFLRIDRFTNPRREVFRGHEVIVFDFAPNPDYKPANLMEKFLHSCSGAVWIDEQARDVVRLEAYMNGNVKIGGGLLASVGRGSAFVFEQTKINDEVWLPTSLEAHVNARVLLVKGFSGNFVDHYQNYQKFKVESVTGPRAVKSN